jgi:site-specific DNA-methyltransferase (adenine-specific)
MEIDYIKQGNCLDLMTELPEKSIDMILCDLPYGTTVNKWDTVIPLDKLWAQYDRVIKINGAIVLTAAQPFTSTLIASNLEMFRYSWVWLKENGTGFINAHHQPLKICEDICVFSKSKSVPSAIQIVTYNPQGLERLGKIVRRGSAGENYNKKTVKNENFQEFTNYPTNLLYFPRDKQKLHPTQKPVSLFEYLIRTYTNQNDLILDNCIGSGTTAVAAINTERHYIGFELDQYYFNNAKNRVQEHLFNRTINCEINQEQNGLF